MSAKELYNDIDIKYIDLEAKLDQEYVRKVMGTWPDSEASRKQRKQERFASIVAKMGKNFVPDLGDNNIIGHWKSEPKTPDYRRRWNGEKYVYEEIK